MTFQIELFYFGELILINANEGRSYEPSDKTYIAETYESFENHFSKTEY